MLIICRIICLIFRSSQQLNSYDAGEAALSDHDSNALIKVNANSQYYNPPAPFHASNVGDAGKTEYANIYIYIC